MASSGALPPGKAFADTYSTGLHHLSEATQLTLLKNIYGALLLSAGCLLSLLLSAGSPGLTRDNPGVSRLLQGLAFPVGLVLVYLAGAELYTGYPMWLTMTALNRRGRPATYVRSVCVSWLGNLAGALFSSYVFTHLTGVLSTEPWRSGVVDQITADVVSQRWHVLFLRAIPCGFLVTVAMVLGTQNHDGVSKALALHLPFFVAAAAKLPHTVEYMYLASLGMLLGAELSVAEYFWKCLLPVTLGNSVGGAVFTGLYGWWVFLKCGNKGMMAGGVGGYSEIQLGDDDEDDEE